MEIKPTGLDGKEEEMDHFYMTEQGLTVYRVGKEREHKSFVSLLLDLAGDESPKAILIDGGEYDLFREYTAEVEKGRIVIPPDDIRASDYFKSYNAFVPNNTKIRGLGDVIFSFEPKKDEISYGASRTWSPLNVYGSVEMENITVICKNARYCLHNDDHNLYPGSVQIYRNCRFEYKLSDKDDQGRLLGFNNAIGFGIDIGSTHVFEDCEIFFNGKGDHSAYYGHNSGRGKGTSHILLKNCYIHASDETNKRVIRFQTLAREQKINQVTAKIENCAVNGGLTLNLYHPDSVQNFQVIYFKTPKMPVDRTIAEGGEIQDPFEIQYIN